MESEVEEETRVLVTRPEDDMSTKSRQPRSYGQLIALNSWNLTNSTLWFLLLIVIIPSQGCADRHAACGVPYSWMYLCSMRGAVPEHTLHNLLNVGIAVATISGSEHKGKGVGSVLASAIFVNLFGAPLVCPPTW